MPLLRLLVLTCLLATTALCRPQVPTLGGRIVGGSDVTIEDYPYQLSLLLSDQHVCGASAIGTNVALTAAHCVDGSSALETQIRAGSDQLYSGGVVLNASAILMHPNYVYFTFDYDVALVTLGGLLPLGSNIALVPLAEDNYAPRAGATVAVSGWGITVNGGDLVAQLQAVNVPVVSNQDCQSAYGSEAITDRMLCAGEAGKDSCQGDSGGPAVEDGKQVGITSWGRDCALPGYPGVYASVGNLRAWIRQNSGV